MGEPPRSADRPGAAPEVGSARGPDDAAPKITLADFQGVDLRVATVLEAAPHPDADRLVLLKVRLGDGTKQLVAGIRPYREPGDLVGRQIIMVDNLEPAVLRGERSEGMLLAVTDGDEFALLVPDRKVRDGSRVS